MAECSIKYSGLTNKVNDILTKRGVKDVRVISTSLEMITTLNTIMERFDPIASKEDPSYWVNYIIGETPEDKINTLVSRLQLISRMMSNDVRELIINHKLVIPKTDLKFTANDPLTVILNIAIQQANDNIKINSEAFKADQLTSLNYNKEQREAIDACYNWCINNTDSDQYYTIQGQAGTGKTTIIKEVVYKIIQKIINEKGGLPEDFKITCATVSNQAASVIRNSMSILTEKLGTKHLQCMSKAKLLGERMDYNDNGQMIFAAQKNSRFTPPIEESDIIIIDECSMMKSEDVNEILEKAIKPGRIVIFMGDEGQLRPIGAVNGQTSPTFANKNISTLIVRERQKENVNNGEQPLISLADIFWKYSMGKENIDIEHVQVSTKVNEKQQGAVIAVSNNLETEPLYYPLFEKALKDENPMLVQILCGTNKAKDTYNNAFHKYVMNKLGKTENHFTHFFDGEMVMSYSNGREINNSEKAIVVKQELVDDNPLSKYGIENLKFAKLTLQKWDGRYTEILYPYNQKGQIFSDAKSGAELIKEYRKKLEKKDKFEFDGLIRKYDIIEELYHGYACTVHKAQGSTYEVAILPKDTYKYYLNPNNKKPKDYARMMYTALTRASKIALVDEDFTQNGKPYDFMSLLSKYNGITQAEIGKSQAIYQQSSEYEVSTKGDKRFSALYAKFKQGTVLFGHDVSGQTIESVYQHGIKQGDWTTVDKEGVKNGTGKPNNKEIIKGDTPEDTYKEGYLPLWVVWASQNPDLIEDLRKKSEGKVLKDSFAKPDTVNQAQALTDILNWTNNKDLSTAPKHIVEELSNYIQGVKQANNKYYEVVKLLGGKQIDINAIEEAVKAAKAGVDFNTVQSFFTKEEQEEIKKGLNGGQLKPVSISRHTDPVFFSKQIVKELEKNAKKELSDPTRINVAEVWTKHDGLPIKEILSACKKYRVAPMVSFSITSLGNTPFEPGVMKYNDLLDRIEKLIKNGDINPATTTIRIDPILPGVTNLDDIKEIVSRCKAMGIKKFVTSVMQSYNGERNIKNNVDKAYREMFGKDYDWKYYYGSNVKPEHYALPKSIEYIGKFLVELNKDPDISIQSCAFKLDGIEPAQCKDPYILEKLTGIETDKNYLSNERVNKKDDAFSCKCFGGSIGDMFAYDAQCFSSCGYCYAANDGLEFLKYYDNDGKLINNEFTVLDNMELEGVGLDNVLSHLTIHAGGALGVDSMFHKALTKYGVKSKQYYVGKKTPWGNVQVTDPELIKEGELQAKLAAAKIRTEGYWEREKEKEKEGSNSLQLVLRDWFQTKYSDTIIAVSWIDEQGDVKGGTGFAVEMAKQYNEHASDKASKKKIYCYDLARQGWFEYGRKKKWNKKLGMYIFDNTYSWFPVDTPVLSKNTACIGTRGTSEKNPAVMELAQKAVNDVVAKTLAQQLSYYKIDKAEMSFDYNNNKRDDVSSADTFNAIIHGERTSTTRYTKDGNIDFWKQFKKGDVVKFYKDKNSDDFVYVKITEPLKELTTDISAEEWSKLEGWSVDYYNRKVKPIIGTSNIPYIIKYEFIATNVENNNNSLMQFIQKHADLFNTNENHVTQVINIGGSEFTMTNSKLAEEIIKGELNITSKESIETLSNAVNGDLLRIMDKNNIYTATIDEVQNNDDGSISIRVNNINISEYKESLKEDYKNMNSLVDIKKVPYKVEHKASARNILGGELYDKRVRYIYSRLNAFIQSMMLRGVKSGELENKKDYSELFKVRPLQDFKQAIIDKFNKEISPETGLLSEAELAKQTETYRKYELFSNEEDLKEYVRKVSANKIEANKFIISTDSNGKYLYFNEMFMDALSMWAKGHNFTLVPTNKGEVNNGKEKSDEEIKQMQADDNTVLDEEYNHKLNWQVEYRKMTDSISVEFKDWLSNISKRDKNGKLILDDIGEIERFNENIVFNDLIDTLSKDCFTLSDMMTKIEEFAEKKPEYLTIVKQLKKAKFAQFRTDMFRLFSVEEIHYNTLYTSNNLVDSETGEVIPGIMIMENQQLGNKNKKDTDKYIKDIINANNKKISYVGTVGKPLFGLSTQQLHDIASNFQLNLIYLHNKQAFLDNITAQGIDIRKSILNPDIKNSVTDKMNTILLGLRTIGYNISQQALQNALLNITPEHQYPIIDISVALYDVFTSFKYEVSIESALKSARTIRALKILLNLVPKDTDTTETSTVYVNKQQYPKYKHVSDFGLLLKHLQDSNIGRYQQYIQDNFKQYDWFYSEGDYKKKLQLFKNAEKSLIFQNGVTKEQKEKYLGTLSYNSDYSFERSTFQYVCELLEKAQSKTNTTEIATIISEANEELEHIPNIMSQLNEYIAKHDNSKHYTEEEKTRACKIEAPKWKNTTLQRIFELSDRNSIQRERVLTYNGRDYFSMTADDIALIALSKYFSTKNEFKKFLMPNYADAGVLEFISLPINSHNEKRKTKELVELYNQEKDRIALFTERKQWRTAVYNAYNKMVKYAHTGEIDSPSNEMEGACFNDFMNYYNQTGTLKNYTDCYYYSYPIQNLEDVDDLSLKEDGTLIIGDKPKIKGNGTKLNFLNFIDNDKDVEGQIIRAGKIEALNLAKICQKYELRFNTNYSDTETDTLYKIISQNETNGLVEGIDYYVNNINGVKQYVQPIEDLINYVHDYMIAKAAIIQLTVCDLAEFKNAVDFQKRFKQVYAGTHRLNTESFEAVDDKGNSVKFNEYARQEMTYIDITDVKMDRSTYISELVKGYKVAGYGKMSYEILTTLANEYRKVNTADGQSFRSLSSMRAILSMSNEWENKHQDLFDKLVKGIPLTTKELKIFINPKKPFMSFWITVIDKATGKKIKKMVQIKNSEFLLLNLYNQTRNNNNTDDSVLFALNKFMEDNGIDTMNFESAIKVGGQGAVDIKQLAGELGIEVINRRDYDYDEAYNSAIKQAVENYYKSTGENKEVSDNADENIQLYKQLLSKQKQKKSERLIDALYYITKINRISESELENESYEDKHNRVKNSCNPEIVKTTPYSNYGIISDEHEHYMDRKQKLGTQLVRLLTSNNEGTIKIGNKKLNNHQIFQLVSKLLTAKGLLHTEELHKLFTNEDLLSSKILTSMQSNSKYSEATIEAAISTNDKDRLNMLGDTVIKERVEALLNSFVREEINKIELDGGTCTQVTAMFSDDLKIIKDRDEEGNVYIKYWQAIAPMPFKSLLKRYMDDKGMMSIEKFMSDTEIDDITKEKMLRVLGCRVPTESKHSIQHIQIVGFSAPNNGSIVMLPYEITVTSGSDFDIDHLYMWRYSFDMVEISKVNEEGKEIKYKKPVFVKYTDERGDMIPFEEMNEKQINNALIDVFWSVLESPNNFVQELTPNGYEKTKHSAYVAYIMGNKEVYEKYAYNLLLNRSINVQDSKIRQSIYFKLNSLDNDSLEKIVENSMNRLSLSNELYYFKQNSFGKGLLGTMAVNNVFLALLQHTDLKISSDYKVILDGYSNDSFNKLRINNDSKKNLTSDTIMELLAAAPDSAKDPMLIFLGASNLTTNAILAASLLGYDTDNIALLFNNEYLKDFLSSSFRDNEILNKDKVNTAIAKYILHTKNINVEDVFKEIENSKDKTKKDSKILYQDKYVTVSANNFRVNVQFSNDAASLTKEDLLLPFDKGSLTQMRVLASFYNFFNIGQDLFDLSMVTRADSTSGAAGSSVANVTAKLLKIQAVIDKSKNGENSLIGVSDLYNKVSVPLGITISNKSIKKDLIDRIGNSPLGHIQAQITLGLENIFNFYRGRITDFCPTLINCYHTLSKMTPNLCIDEKIIKKLVTDFINYKLSNIEFFGNQTYDVNGNNIIVDIKTKADYVVNNTWRDINTIKTLYPQYSNNELLKRLEVNKRGIVVLPNAGDLKETEKNRISNSWEELLNSPYDIVKELGYNLIRYSFYRNTMRFAPDGFGHLCPNVRKNIPGYSKALEDTYTDNSSFVSFLSQFIKNNYDIFDQTYTFDDEKTQQAGIRGEFFYYIFTNKVITKLKSVKLEKNKVKITTNLEKEDNTKESNSKQDDSIDNNEFLIYNQTDLQPLPVLDSKSMDKYIKESSILDDIFADSVKSNKEINISAELERYKKSKKENVCF